MKTQAQHVTAMMKASPDARRIVFGSVVSYGTIRTSDTTRDDGNGGLVRERLTVLTLPTGALALVDGSAVTVHADKLASSATVAYVVRDIMLFEDGGMTKYRVVPS
jgi:hypothetical protein